MWLWYLELYVAVLVAFLLGAGLGIVVVRLVVRRTTGFSLGLTPRDGSAETASSDSGASS